MYKKIFLYLFLDRKINGSFRLSEDNSPKTLKNPGNRKLNEFFSLSFKALDNIIKLKSFLTK